MKDRKRQDMQDKDQPLYQELTETILGCCFDVMNEAWCGLLGVCFLLVCNSDKQNSA